MAHLNLKKVFHYGFVAIEILLIVWVIWGRRWMSHAPLSAEERWRKFDLVLVDFDPVGGMCQDNCRVVVQGERYKGVANVFPAESKSNFVTLDNCSVKPFSGGFSADLANITYHNVYINYFSTNAIPVVPKSSSWTYVIDIESIDGEYSKWSVGHSVNGTGTQMGKGAVPVGVEKGVHFLTLSGNEAKNCALLDRAFIQLGPGQHLKMRWRTALFAGTAVNESNYHYVDPGETIECPLPVPTRAGYKFEGWYDGDRKIDEDSEVTRKDAHTLKAKWSKL